MIRVAIVEYTEKEEELLSRLLSESAYSTIDEMLVSVLESIPTSIAEPKDLKELESEKGKRR